MPKCLFRYQWVKLPRTHLPVGKGIMGYWAKLASRAAFRKGRAKYCGYTNDVMPGMWSGGVVGLKSILGVKSRTEALEIMNTLSRFGYIRYTLDEKTKKLEYAVTDWVVKCSGTECMSGTVYATDGYGFLCLPRNITQRLADQHYTFGESDAWLDLWCHTVWQETGNAFSYLAPAVQFGRLGAALTLEALGRRWGWEKTKVWRFFQKNGDAFALHRLPGSYRQTEGQGRRRLLTPDEVLRIPNEELLVVIRGHNVLKLKKFDYADHPLAKELTPVSILDYTPPHAAAPFLQTETTLPHAVSEERPHTSSIPSKRRTLYSSAKPPSEF